MLPTEKTPAKKNLEELIIMILGQPGIGKSTLGSKFDKALFLATEKGLNCLDVFQLPCPDWKTLTDACAEIAAGKHGYKTIIVDTIDNYFSLCTEHVCAKLGISHPSDLDYGKGWNAVKTEASRVLTKLSMLPYGLVLIGHVKEVELKTRTASITKTVPTLTPSAQEVVVNMADIILYCESVVTEDGEQRIMHTKGTENWVAKDHTGRLPDVLPLDYQAFLKAFNGKGGK
jgi:hypothetical protein